MFGHNSPLSGNPAIRQSGNPAIRQLYSNYDKLRVNYPIANPNPTGLPPKFFTQRRRGTQSSQRNYSRKLTQRTPRAKREEKGLGKASCFPKKTIGVRVWPGFAFSPHPPRLGELRVGPFPTNSCVSVREFANNGSWQNAGVYRLFIF